MNHIYRVVWNHSKNAWQAVVETAISHGKSKSAKSAVPLALAMLLSAGSAHAQSPAPGLPTGGNVVVGSGTISQSGNSMTVNQTSNNMALDWQNFSIGQGNNVKFIQPGTNSIALNRVIGSDVSLIQGSLTANGQVYLINPNGILFSPTARVDVGGLVASTLNLSNSDFINGHLRFDGASSNAIVNQGAITAARGGTIALIAAKIQNAGTLTADSGNVLLGAGNTVTLDLGGPVKIEVNRSALQALIENGGAIRADGGTVLLTAHGASELFGTVINNTGLVEARTLANNQKGKIALLGGMQGDGISVGGTLDASAPNGGDGGSIETSAASVTTQPGLVVNAGAAKGQGGTWLVDPYDYTIDAAAAGTIASTLNSGTSMTVSTQSKVTSLGATATTNGDITVSSAIAKTSGGDATLTLQADRNININSDITSTAGKLNLTLSAANASNATVGGVDVNGDLKSNGGNILIGSNAGPQAHGMGYALNQSSSTAAVTVEQNRNILSAGGDIVINGKSTDVTGKNSYSGVAGGVYVKSGASILSGTGNLFITGESDKDQYSFGFGVEANSNTLTTIGSSPGAGFVVVNGVNKVSVDGAVGLVNNGSIAQITFTGPTVANYIIEVNGSAQLNAYTGQKTSGCVTGFSYCGVMQVPGSNHSYLYAGYSDNNLSTKPVIDVFVGGSKTYDGSTAATNLASSNFNILGLPPGYSTTNLNFSTSSKDVGTYTLTSSSSNPKTYTDPSTNTTYVVSYYPYDNGYTINPKSLTASFTASNKVYDGLTTVAVSGATLSGVLAGDSVSVSDTGAAFNDKNAGTGKTVNINGVSLSGASASDYSISATATTLADITPRPVTVSGVTASNKTYDGTTVATITTGAASVGGFLSGDSVNVTIGTIGGTFADKNAGDNKAINLSGITLAGTGASNYTVSGVNGVSAKITPKALTMSGLTAASSKNYDGTTNAAVTGTPLLQGSIAAGSGTATDGKPYIGDTINFTGTATGSYNSAHVSDASTVTFGGLALDNSNYSLTMPASVSARITPATLTATLSNTNVSKVYEGTVAAPSDFSPTWNFSGLVSGDTAAMAYTLAAYNSKDVGTASKVTVSGLSISSIAGSKGSLAADYQLDATSKDVTASITPKALSVTGLKVNDKIYDGNTSASLTNDGTVVFTGILGSDDVSVNTGSISASFANKNVGTNKAVNLSGVTLTGNNASDYSVSDIQGLGASITQKALTLGNWGASNKTYDGKATATITTSGTSLTGLVQGDDVSLGTVSGSFDNKNVGTNKTVNLTSVNLSGNDAGNYTVKVADSGTASANVMPKAITLEDWTAADKVYDGTKAASIDASHAALTGAILGDQVSLGSVTGSFVDKNVGSGKSVTLSSITLSGNDASNYTALGADNVTASITPKTLSVSGLAAQGKTYDGTISDILTGTASLSGVLNGDHVALGGSVTNGTFTDANAGANKVVTANLSNLTLGGTDASNYQISGVTTPLTADISKAALTVTGLTALNKTYDGKASAVLAGNAGLIGVIGNDAVNLVGSATSGAFADANAGNGKLVTANLDNLSLAGTGAGNYQISGVTKPLTADIGKASLAVSGLTAQDKIYDGTTGASLAGKAGLSGVIGNDIVTLDGSATSGTFGDVNAGTGKAVTADLSGLHLNGAAAGNYQISGVTSPLNADIGKASLTVSGLTAQGKTFDGNTSIALTGTPVLNGIVGNDAVGLEGSVTFGAVNDPSVGNEKLVKVDLGGLKLTGAGAGNYQLSGVTKPVTVNVKAAPVDPQQYAQQPPLVPKFLDNGVTLGNNTPTQPGLGGLNYVPVNASANSEGANTPQSTSQATKGGGAEGMGPSNLPVNIAGPTSIFVVNGGISMPVYTDSTSK